MIYLMGIFHWGTKIVINVEMKTKAKSNFRAVIRSGHIKFLIVMKWNLRRWNSIGGFLKILNKTLELNYEKDLPSFSLVSDEKRKWYFFVHTVCIFKVIVCVLLGQKNLE